jgi:hypothetical protein
VPCLHIPHNTYTAYHTLTICLLHTSSDLQTRFTKWQFHGSSTRFNFDPFATSRVSQICPYVTWSGRRRGWQHGTPPLAGRCLPVLLTLCCYFALSLPTRRWVKRKRKELLIRLLKGLPKLVLHTWHCRLLTTAELRKGLNQYWTRTCFKVRQSHITCITNGDNCLYSHGQLGLFWCTARGPSKVTSATRNRRFKDCT